MISAVLLFSVVTGCASQAAQASAAKPNIVLILSDDMRADDLAYMSKTQELVAGQGAEYKNAFVTTPLCCPSRASILRGQYAHNHGVQRNGRGYERFAALGRESSTVATWLHSAGYETALVGKYLNGYDLEDASHVPPGWDEWYAVLKDDSYYDYDLSENGVPIHYGSTEAAYQTDVLAQKATDIVRRSADDGRPLFLYVAPKAPHWLYTPAVRHEGLFEGMTAPRTPSFNEEDVSDKPGWVSQLPRFDAVQAAAIDEAQRGRLQTLQALDDLVAGVIDEIPPRGARHSSRSFGRGRRFRRTLPCGPQMAKS
jgi:N-acetylglucosamine-6-sulfatase